MHTNGIKYLQCDKCSFICRPLMRLFLKHYKRHFCDGVQPPPSFSEEYAAGWHADDNCKTAVTVVATETDPRARGDVTAAGTGNGESSQNTAKYQCERCSKKFEQRRSFCRHVKMHDRRVFRCKRCNCKFKTKMAFRAHCRRHLRRKILFECELCGKQFRSKDGYKYHRLNKCVQYECELCDEQLFASKALLREHAKNEHDVELDDEQLRRITEMPKSMCFVCGKIIKDINLDRHMLVHTEEKPFVCDLCGKRFKFKSALRDHIMAKLGVKDYVCEICGRGFVKRCYLNKHVSFHFLGKDEQQQPPSQHSLHAKTVRKIGRQAQRRLPPIRHRRSSDGGGGMGGDDGDDNQTVVELFTCDLCAKIYPCKSSLRQHLLRDVICLLCDEIFISHDLLKQHVFSMHSAEAYREAAANAPNGLQTSFVYPCELCGRRFTSEPRFQQHVAGETRCELCDRMFGSQIELKAHVEDEHDLAEYRKIASLRWRKRIRLGGGEGGCGGVNAKEFSCHLCGKKLFYKRTLLLHLRMHSGLKPHKCEYCGKAYTSKHSLNAHLISERNLRKYACSYCGKRYNFNSDLIVHVKQRHETRQFCCHVCGKEFGLLKYLKDHSTIHSTVKPFNCDSCNVGFRLKKFLLKHNKKYHSTNASQLLDSTDAVVIDHLKQPEEIRNPSLSDPM